MKKAIVEIGHPAHVHQFKYLYSEMIKRNWEVFFVTKDKEYAISLLQAYGLPFKVIGSTKHTMLAKFFSMPVHAFKLLSFASKFNPSIYISRGSPLSGISSFIFRKPHIAFSDTESAKLLDFVSKPITNHILTIDSYLKNLGKKQVRYPGYHELAYLHPNRFVADHCILDVLGVDKGERYAVVRFVAWTAHHDVGMKGMTYENKLKLIRNLSKHMKVFISSEAELPNDLKDYQIKIKSEDMHNVLAFADLFVGESSTMSTEAGVLGVPAVYINNSQLGYVMDLAKHGLIFPFTESEPDQELAIQKAVELASTENNDIYKKRRDELLSDKIDVTAFMLWFVENYPKSVDDLKQRRVSWEQFK